MQWQRLLSSAAAVVGAVAVGCQSAPSLRAADPGVPPPAATRPQKADGDARPVRPAGAVVAPDPIRGGRVVATVRAMVNGVPVFDDEVMTEAAGQLFNIRVATDEDRAQVKKIKDSVLETLIERELLCQEAKHKLEMAGKKDVLKKVEEEADEQFKLRVNRIRAKFKSDEEFNAFLKAQGTNLEEQKRIQRRMTIAQQYLQSNVMRHVDRRCRHEEVYDYYRTHPEEFQRTDSVKWQDIFLDASQYPSRQAAYRTAEELVRQAKAGDTDAFARLCEKYDNGLAKTRKGAGLGTRREDVSPSEAAPVLFQMRDGDVGPIIPVPAGFHVIRLVKRTHAGLAPFDEEAQKAIKDKLRSEAFTQESKRFLDELKKTAHIERFNSP
jgi:parvulin-like peptidyl-prolyl isomerase